MESSPGFPHLASCRIQGRCWSCVLLSGRRHQRSFQIVYFCRRGAYPARLRWVEGVKDPSLLGCLCSYLNGRPCTWGPSAWPLRFLGQT